MSSVKVLPHAAKKILQTEYVLNGKTIQIKYHVYFKSIVVQDSVKTTGFGTSKIYFITILQLSCGVILHELTELGSKSLTTDPTENKEWFSSDNCISSREEHESVSELIILEFQGKSFKAVLNKMNVVKSVYM